MPYTQEELQNLSWYQNLIDEDEQQYLQKRARLENEANISGSANQGKIIRDNSNTILLFEDPYANALQEDEESKIAKKLSDKYGKGSIDLQTGTFTPTE